MKDTPREKNHEPTVAQLRRSEQFYRLLIEHFPNGVVALFDQDLRYRLVGGMGLAASGMTKERFEGKLLREVLPAHTCAVLEPCYRKALRGEEAVTEVPYMNRVLLVHALPLGDEHGGARGELEDGDGVLLVLGARVRR